MKAMFLRVFSVCVALLLLAGCGNVADTSADTSAPASAPNALPRETHTLSLGEDGLHLNDPYPGMYLYAGNRILYGANFGNATTLASDERVYLCDLSTHTATQIKSTKQTYAWSGQMLWMGDGKAYRTSMENGGQLESFDLQTGEYTVLESQTISSPFSYCDKLDDHSFVYNLVRDLSSVWEYEVRLFDTRQGKSRPFIQTQYVRDEGKGETICQARVKGGYIHVLSERTGAGAGSLGISVYAPDGTLVERRPLPADVESNVLGDRQRPIWLDIWGDYYVLTTVSQVSFLCKWENGTFNILSIPTEHKRCCRIGAVADSFGRYGYLIERNEEGADSLLLFDKETASFLRYTFDIVGEYNVVDWVYENETYDLAVACSPQKPTPERDFKLRFYTQEEILKEAVLVD